MVLNDSQITHLRIYEVNDDMTIPPPTPPPKKRPGFLRTAYALYSVDRGRDRLDEVGYSTNSKGPDEETYRHDMTPYSAETLIDHIL